MTYWQTSRAPSGAQSVPGSPHRATTQRDSIPSAFLFPRGKFSQTLIDIAAIFSCALVVVVTGAGILFALFVLLFVRL